MKEKCYDEGTMQAFLDGELSSETLEKVAYHTAHCEKCNLLLEKIEDQSALVFAALDNELNTLVPTERIRTNLYRAIGEIEEVEKPEGGSFSRLTWLFANPIAPAFASFFLIAGVVVFYLSSSENSEIAVNKSSTVIVQTPQNTPRTGNLPQTKQSETSTEISQTPPIKLKNEFIAMRSQNSGGAVIRKTVLRKSVENLKSNSEKKSLPSVGIEEKNNVPSVAETSAKSTVEGEEIYLKTIASLNKTVEKNKDEVLRPSARFAFEKDLAIVDDAIVKMKTEVRNNPKNEAAKEMLRTSYQSKIDLLNSVAERQNLTAALR